MRSAANKGLAAISTARHVNAANFRQCEMELVMDRSFDLGVRIDNMSLNGTMHLREIEVGVAQSYP
jgi:hypothetical protein